MYALESIINNRRLVNLELEATAPQQAKNFIIEISALIPFDLIQLNKKEILKAFTLHKKDVALSDCSFQVSLENHEIRINISENNSTVASVPQEEEKPATEKK